MTATKGKMTINYEGIVAEARASNRKPEYLMATFPGMNIAVAEALLSGKAHMDKDGNVVTSPSPKSKGVPPLLVVLRGSGQMRDALERAHDNSSRINIEIQYAALEFVRKWARFSADDKYEALLVLIGKDAKLKENGEVGLLTQREAELLNLLAIE